MEAINKLTMRGMFFFDYGNAFLLEAGRAGLYSITVYVTYWEGGMYTIKSLNRILGRWYVHIKSLYMI